MTKTELDKIIEISLEKSFDRGMSVMNRNIDENGQFKEKHVTVKMTDLQDELRKSILSLIEKEKKEFQESKEIQDYIEVCIDEARKVERERAIKLILNSQFYEDITSWHELKLEIMGE